jgi:hypothetical protein
LYSPPAAATATAAIAAKPKPAATRAQAC